LLHFLYEQQSLSPFSTESITLVLPASSTPLASTMVGNCTLWYGGKYLCWSFFFGGNDKHEQEFVAMCEPQNRGSCIVSLASAMQETQRMDETPK
jgi:hypothetical protein